MAKGVTLKDVKDKAKRPEVGATVGPKTSSIVFDLIYKAGLYKARFYSTWIWSN